MFALLKTFSWQELLQHPWRNAAAVLAVMLGVALAFSVHLINQSALDEFDQAARSVSGQSDLSLQSLQGTLDEAWYQRLARLPEVTLASPVLEVDTYARSARGKQALKVLGVDALLIAAVSPDLLPQPERAADSRLSLFAPGLAFANASALALSGVHTAAEAAGPHPMQTQPRSLQLQAGMQWLTVQLAGRISASGAPLLVLDLGAAQDLFGQQGQLTRIDLRLQAGVDRHALAGRLMAQPDWPAHLRLSAATDPGTQVSALTRAYRVNLTVLALIALFTGAFLVFSVLSLSVAKRLQQFALLGVLGLPARSRMALVLLESLVLGLVGSVAGLLLGTALAALALRWLGGDLGGGFFAGVTPPLQFSWSAAWVYGALGVAAALAGGGWPARSVHQLPPAQALKGLGDLAQAPVRYRLALFLIAASALLASAPPVFGMALGAYVSVALLLLGGIGTLPALIALLLGGLRRCLSGHVLGLLALERARRQRGAAAVALSGVVASLALAVALTVMVASFRQSVTDWLQRMLPADLYVRSSRSLAASDTVYFSAAEVQAAAQLPGVTRVQAQRSVALTLQPGQPPVALLAREIGDPARTLPLVAPAHPVPPGQIGLYVSEAVVDLYAAKPGMPWPLFDKAFRPLAQAGKAQAATFFVAGVWRDYARQSGAIAIERSDFVRLTGDQRSNDLALWLHDASQAATVQSALQALVAGQTLRGADPNQPPTDASANALTPPASATQPAGSDALLEFGSTAEIRALSLQAFDRSFAVTYWLQAVAIGIGLFGVAASFSAQVLARRKEFGLLTHLGLTRGQILRLVALEGLGWILPGALAGLLLGLCVSVLLVHVVNPQSFHWTMDLYLPWARLLTLCLAVLTAGTLTAWLSARAAVSRDAVLAVKQDW